MFAIMFLFMWYCGCCGCLGRAFGPVRIYCKLIIYFLVILFLFTYLMEQMLRPSEPRRPIHKQKVWIDDRDTSYVRLENKPTFELKEEPTETGGITVPRDSIKGPDPTGSSCDTETDRDYDHFIEGNILDRK
jgi:hypothetical protein